MTIVLTRHLTLFDSQQRMIEQAGIVLGKLYQV
jgi:hypothetical protein